MVEHGLVWHGKTGMAGLDGWLWNGTVGFGAAGADWRGMAWRCDEAGVAGYGSECSARFGTAWLARLGLARPGEAWRDQAGEMRPD